MEWIGLTFGQFAIGAAGKKLPLIRLVQIWFVPALAPSKGAASTTGVAGAPEGAHEVIDGDGAAQGPKGTGTVLARPVPAEKVAPTIGLCPPEPSPEVAGAAIGGSEIPDD